MTQDVNWNEEFSNLNFIDKRLSKRFTKLMDTLYSFPSESILSACDSLASAKAAYRFLSNPSISFSSLLNAVSKATIVKMQHFNNEKFLLIQDTTSISFGNRKGISGMGFYSNSTQKGLLLHSCIAVTQTGIPIGLLYQTSFTRTHFRNTVSKEKRKFRPVEDKESFKWLSALSQYHEYLPKTAARITICDREGDFYELFAKAESLNEKFLVRVAQNRPTKEGKNIFELLKSSPVRGSLLVEISRNPYEKTPARKIFMSYHYEKITIKRPQRRKEKNLPDELKLTVIYVHDELQKEKIQWILITNDTVETNKDAEEKIRNYIQRWKIERFHYVLKNGCRIEDKQSRSYNTLRTLILMYSVISIQILTMMYTGRNYPEMPAEVFLDKEELKVLFCISRKSKNKIRKEYLLKDMLIDLAKLGGYKGKSDVNKIGVQSIWKGMERFFMILDYRAYL